MRPAILFLPMLVSLATLSWATVYTVLPDGTGDFSTIQAGVDAVVDGDVLELGIGTLSGPGNRDVDYLGKVVVIRSQSGDPETCIIDCAATEFDPHRPFHLHSGEPAGATLSGVTITHGWMSDSVRPFLTAQSRVRAHRGLAGRLRGHAGRGAELGTPEECLPVGTRPIRRGACASPRLAWPAIVMVAALQPPPDGFSASESQHLADAHAVIQRGDEVLGMDRRKPEEPIRGS